MTVISPTARLRLADILDVTDELAKIVEGRDLTEYTGNQEFRWGVERALEIIGEAMNQALKSDPQLIAVIPNAREVTGMRNWLIHAYHDVDDDVVWNAATRAAPELATQIRAVLDEDQSP
jgi:uncharacterized protein with HEPN domain